MQRNGTEHARNPRRTAESDASQPIGGQPRTDDDEDTLEPPEQVPSFLTARELQAREPAQRDTPTEGADQPAGKPSPR